MMAKVKKLNRLGMELKTAGKITKFQVINRKGQPVLQTGLRNQNFADYQGDTEVEDVADNGEWTLVENRRKRPHPDGTLTSPNSRPLEADRPTNSQPPPTAATWAALTEQEFPELNSKSKPTQDKQQMTTARMTAQRPATQRGVQSESADQWRKEQPSGKAVEAPREPQHQPSRRPTEAPRGSQPGSYPASRASSQQNSRPSTPPPIRSIFDDDRSDDPRINQRPKPQRQMLPKAVQHQQHSRNGY
jgi:hypothetical protein